MKWSSAIADLPDLEQAVAGCAAAIRADLGGARPDLAVMFVSSQYAAPPAAAVAALRQALQPRHSIGCSAGGVVGAGREIENCAAVSVTAAILPGVEITPFHLDSDTIGNAPVDPIVWRQRLGLRGPETPHFVLLADPFSFNAGLLTVVDRCFPDSRIVGGLASGATQPGEAVLYLDDGVMHAGAVGVALQGNVAIDTLVAQGCRPIGLPMFVTRCHGNLIEELDGCRPHAVLVELYQSLPRRDQELLQTSLFVGIVMEPQRQEYGQGDFLIRNVIGLQRETGCIAVGAQLEAQTVVQFHLRDAQTSRDDLEMLLDRHLAAQSAPPSGALLFSCLGRGVHLYGAPDHDTTLFHRRVGAVPLGGFFCNGEIGPVHGRTFLHGYTSSFGLFRPR